MNIILYFSLIFLFIIFSYFLLFAKENFKQQETFKDCIKIDRDYDQVLEFIPDSYNYDFSKDAGIMKGIVLKDLTLGEIEYANLSKRLAEQEKKELENELGNNANINLLTKREKKLAKNALKKKKENLEKIIFLSLGMVTDD